jgi:hypothetical protein
MKRISMIATLLVVVMISMAGCAARGSAVTARSDARSAAPAAMPAPPVVEARPVEAVVKESYGGAESPASATATERMIISTVEMAITVEDTDKTLDELQKLVASKKGYVTNSRMWREEERPLAQVTVRVPAETLNEMLASLRTLALRVESESTTGVDVTEQYTDTQARLRNLEATEKELLALLTEVRENRGKADEILAVHRELTNIRGQIEALKGKAQYLERMTALATINLNIRPKEAPRPVSQGQWDPLITLNKALRGFVTFVQVFLDALIYVLIFSPFVLVPVLVLWLIGRALRRRNRHKTDATPKS